MKNTESMKLGLRAVTAMAIAAATYAGSLVLSRGAETKAAGDPKPAGKPEKKPSKKAEKRKLSGAELYAINCNRCHNERYPTEFTAAQWKTIMLEMRTRANLTGEQADAILKYLQGDSGTP